VYQGTISVYQGTTSVYQGTTLVVPFHHAKHRALAPGFPSMRRRIVVRVWNLATGDWLGNYKAHSHIDTGDAPTYAAGTHGKVLTSYSPGLQYREFRS
jgi:hypothetical protein